MTLAEKAAEWYKWAGLHDELPSLEEITNYKTITQDPDVLAAYDTIKPYLGKAKDAAKWGLTSAADYAATSIENDRDFIYLLQRMEGMMRAAEDYINKKDAESKAEPAAAMAHPQHTAYTHRP